MPAAKAIHKVAQTIAKSELANGVTETRSTARKGGLMAVLAVSEPLKKFLGVSECSRTETTKRLWEYIKQNDLQNPNEKRQVLCDPKLKTIFGDRDTVEFGEISKLLSPHFIPDNSAPRKG